MSYIYTYEGRKVGNKGIEVYIWGILLVIRVKSYDMVILRSGLLIEMQPSRKMGYICIEPLKKQMGKFFTDTLMFSIIFKDTLNLLKIS